MLIAAIGSSPLVAHDRRAHAAAIGGAGERGARAVGPLEHVASPAVSDESFAGSPLLFDSDAAPTVSETSDAASRNGDASGRVVAASASSADDILVAQDQKNSAGAEEPVAPPSVFAVRQGSLDASASGANYAYQWKLSLTLPAGETAPPVVIAADVNEEELRRRAVIERTTELKERDTQAIEAAVNEISEQQADYADDLRELNAADEADSESEARAARAAAEFTTAEVREQLRIDAVAAFAAQANVDGYAAFALLG